MTLRPYQHLCVADAVAFVDEVSQHDEWTGVQRRRLYAAPTGSGKTRIQLEILRRLRAGGLDAWAVTPSLEILRGFLAQAGVEAPAGASDDALAALGETIHVSTPTRLRNRCLDGRREVPDVWLVDEVHHAVEDNEISGCNFALGPGSAWLGFTATPYRGGPAGTAKLREAWGEPTLLLTYPEAVADGYVELPRCEIVPLVDDDQVRVVNGEFQEKASSGAYANQIGALAELCARYAAKGPAAPTFDVPTCVSVPSTATVGALVEALDAIGVEAFPVTQATKGPDRERFYDMCRRGLGVLVQIKVVSEGVDMPWLGRMIDARPLISPVAWLQQFGRITRPGHGPKHYVCTNRNLERHAYLLQGALPRSVVAAAQTAFAGPSKRTVSRAVGLEALGRLKAVELPLADGVRTEAYMIYTSAPTAPDARIMTEYAILLDPCHDEPIVATRVNAAKDGEEVTWGRWQRASLPADFAGYASSARRGSLTDKQRAFWSRCARRYGLDPEAAKSDKFSMRQFQALPVLKDLGLSLHATPVASEGA